MDERGRGQAQETRTGGVEVGSGSLWQDRKPVRVKTRVPDLWGGSSQEQRGQGDEGGARAFSPRLSVDELTNVSCLILKCDQKHTHTRLIISVKYSFNNVRVVKTVWFYRLHKNIKRRAQINPLFHRVRYNVSTNTRHASATMEPKVHKTPETGEQTCTNNRSNIPAWSFKTGDYL